MLGQWLVDPVDVGSVQFPPADEFQATGTLLNGSDLPRPEPRVEINA
jgi:hypothetical protein